MEEISWVDNVINEYKNSKLKILFINSRFK